ncbi:MAG: MFS transporter [Deltaproteobacteria bacterium]|nr:MFS transporter [Deltaproteobacteria bacterium]
MFDSGPGGRFRYLVFLAPFLLSQLAFYAIVFEPRQSLFYAQSRGVAEQVGRSLAGDLEYLLSRNVPLEIVPNLPRHLEGLRESLPVIGHLAVIGPDGHLLASAGENPNWAASSPGLRLSLPLSGEAGGVEITLSSHGLRLATLRVMLDSLTMTLVASLLLVELTRLIIIRADRDGGRPWTEKPQVMRPLAFICLFAMDMSFSFIPLRMAEISPVLLGLPESVVLGLPISAEMLMVGLATIGGGFLVGRVAGWRFLFLSGLLMMAVGYVLSGLAGGAAFYIAARAVSGLGYGLLNLGASIFVITRAGQKEKGSGMGELTAGFFAGSLCGCAAGGLMADRLGFAPVFYAATFIFLTVWFLVLIFFPKSPATSPATSEMESSRLSLRTLLGFVGDRQVVNMSLTQVLPIAIVTVGLLNYFLPIYMSRIGAGPAAIGQLNILFSLVIIFAGPRFGRAIDASGRKYAYLILGGLFAALALPSFFLIPALGGIITGIFFLALSSSISENGHPAYLLRLPTAIKLGVGPSISLYTALIRLGQVLGPMAVAAALNFGGQKGLAWLGAVIVVLNIIFGLMARKAET